MRTLLAVLVIVMLGVGGAVAIVLAGDEDEGNGDPAATVDEPGVPENTVLVTGTAVRLALDPTLLSAVPFPITVRAPEPGTGTATISPVIVDDREVSIVWSGGTPLEFRALAAEPQDLTLDPARVEVDSTGAHVALGGVAGALTPGPYEVRGSVAVGTTGLARPVDAVTFEATDDTTATFEGTVSLDLAPRPMTFAGPGVVVVEGLVDAVTGDDEHRLAGFTTGSVPYRVGVTWESGTVSVDGRIDGDLRDTRPATGASTPSTSDAAALRAAPPRIPATPQWS